MQNLLEQILAGIGTGFIYSCLAIAIVVTYKATKIINFAQGEMAMLSTYISWYLIEKLQFSFWTAFVIALMFSIVLGILLQTVFIRPLKGMPAINLSVVTIGLLLILNSLAGWAFTYESQTFPTPFDGPPFKLGSLTLVRADAGIMLTGLLTVSLVFAIFKFTDLGLRMRAVALNHQAAAYLGVRVDLVTGMGWGLASFVGAISSILAAPTIFLTPNMMHGVLIYSLAAAVMGGLDSPLGALICGILLGITENLIGTYLTFIGPSLKLSVALLIILIVMVFKPHGLFGKVSIERV